MHRTGLAGIPILVALLILACTPSVSAQSQDRLLVVDAAGLFGERLDDVEAAAEGLQSRGADVRVRTVFTCGPSGNLDQYEADLESNSPSWLGADGNRKNNLIVILICLEGGGQTGLFYGSYWESALGSSWHSIQADVMNPRFREGDYAGGTVAGLEEIERHIDSNGAGDGSTGGASATGLFLAVVVVAAALIALFLYTSRRKSQARRAGLRQKALLAKQAAAAGINALIETLQMLHIKVNVTGEKVAVEEAGELRTALTDARRLVDISSMRYSELSHSAGDPDNPKLGEAELAAIEPEYTTILENLRQARDSVKRVEGAIAAVLGLIDAFPGKVIEVESAITRVAGRQADLRREGFNTAYVADLLAQVTVTLTLAQDLAGNKRIKEATEYVSRAGTQVQQAAQATEELPLRKQEAETAVPQLASRISQVSAKVEQGQVLFEELSRSYAETSWVSIRGNGTEAENRVTWAEGVLEDARLAVSMEQQEWHKALELVNRGNGWLTEAESLVAAISELDASLVTARRDAPAEITAARADIQKAWEYIARYDDDIRESLEEDLRTAEGLVAAAEEEMKQAKPDYLRVFKLAREANDNADHILAQARDDREAAVRLRARAASAMRDAEAEVAMVERYIQVRHPFVRDAARNRLTDATEALRQARVTAEAGAQLELAQRAESAARDAYAMAQRDVDHSWGASQPVPGTAGGSPTMNIPTILIPTGWSSGGSRPWGSRPSGAPRSSRPSGGGGGSTGWGSRGGGRSGGRGGGSTGW